MVFADCLHALMTKQPLSGPDMQRLMGQVMSGELSGAQIGALLVALRVKGETVTEISAAAQVLREHATPLKIKDNTHLVDTCGTGGDGANTFNVSTASALVVAAAGGKVAKHGNRSVSSRSGSADVLELAGVNLDLTPDQVVACIEQIGFGFLFAPKYHQALRHVAQVRRELGVRTLFNLLAPMANPAGARRQLIGVYGRKWLKPVAEALQQLGSEHVLVVHAEDGLDEISIAASTQVAELRHGHINTYSITPSQFGISKGALSELAVENAADSLALLRKALAGETGPWLDIVALNAGAAIYVAGLSDNLASGIRTASHILDQGQALRKLQDLITFSQSFSPS
ncbi:MAG: anthranilate phosphoribosyltransferase [Methylococcales bacterium]|nr:anthranilate phosphoribosyltransferase [Methylococcales bacterium]